MSVTVYPQYITTSFSGLNGAGTVTATGLKVGDKLLWLGLTTTSSFADKNQQLNGFAWFELVISTNDQIQQIDARDHSTESYNAIFLRNI